jgi:hypothetical protein
MIGDDDFRFRRHRPHDLSAKERADLPPPRMIWLRYAIALVAIIITGRIHDKRLDEQDELDAKGYL